MKAVIKAHKYEAIIAIVAFVVAHTAFIYMVVESHNQYENQRTAMQVQGK